MQGVSGQNHISISSESSVAGTRTASSEAVVSCFINGFSGACNAVVNRSGFSSAEINERRRNYDPYNYSFPASSKADASIAKELFKAESRKNAGGSHDNRASDPVISSFVHCFSSACNAVINHSGVHDALSSPWNNERRATCSPAKYPFSTAAENARDSRDHLSSYKGALNNASEKYRQYSYDKSSYYSR